MKDCHTQETISQAVEAIEQLRENPTLPRKVVHDVNNSLAKITNALWLLDFESDKSSANAREYQALIQTELNRAMRLLEEPV